jgi:hypothetical protein
MDNKLVSKLVKSLKLDKYKRIPAIYKYMEVKSYKELVPYTYTILLQDTKIITTINKKKRISY